MNSFTYWSPTKVIFGADTASSTGKEIKAFGGTNVLVFFGLGSAVKSGVLDTVTKSLLAEGIKYSLVGGVQINPLVEFAQKAVDEYRGMGIDFVLGVGGGSVIDTAKAVAHGLAAPDTPLWDFFSLKTEVKASLPIGTVLTIAAAGSETSMSAVLTNEELGIKRGLGTHFNRPKFAVMDPLLTYTLPPRHTACGITDILMHTLDRYFAPDTDNAVTDELAEALMRVIVKYGKIAMDKPREYKARAELMWAGSLSHNGLTGLGQTMDFGVHQLGHALSGKYDIPHGESLSIAWPAWARYCLKLCIDSRNRDDIARFAKYARSVWGITNADDEAAAFEGIAATEDFFRLITMPVTLSESVGEKCKNDIEELTDFCTYHRTRTIGSFKVLEYEAIKTIFKTMV
ncbi:MAG: iron-containing alcohol dehydrogenase [Oscillospiraceae bacterium]|nr:iron-containing alcohol dehydrogenase [Oscillospiraceae bacterium]